MKEINTYITEKLVINKDIEDPIDKREYVSCKDMNEVMEYAKSLPYDFKKEPYILSTGKVCRDAFYLDYNDKLRLYIAFPKDTTYVYYWKNKEKDKCLWAEEVLDKDIKKIYWDEFLIPEKYIYYLRNNKRPTSINRMTVHKMWTLADKIEELL